MEAQGIGNVVETDAVGELGIEQADDMTPRAEGSRFGFTVRGPRQGRHQIAGNQIAKLPQKRKLTGGWLVSCLFLYAFPCGNGGNGKPASQPFLTPQPSNL